MDSLLSSISSSFGGLSGWLLAIIAVSSALQLLGVGCLIRFYFRKPPKRDWSTVPRDQLPGVTIIKPCYRAQDGEEYSFVSFFEQDYPGPIQLLFAVSNETDPIVPLVKTFLARYPHVDAQLIVSRTRNAFWKKVDALYDAHHVAKHDLLIWSDSDVIVERDYVSKMVACMSEPGVSVVTTPQYDTGANNLASGFKVLGNNCDLATYVMIFDSFYRDKRVGWGHSMSFRKSEFDSFGEKGWNLMNRFLADDQALPFLFIEHGKKVVFRNIYCPVQYAGKTFANVITQKRRFVWCQRIAIPNRAIYSFALLAYPQIPALALLFVTGFSSLGLAVFGAVAAMRIGISFLFEALFIRSVRMSLRYFWTILLWDLMQIYFILDGLVQTTIRFDGKTYRVVNRYFLEQVT